MFNNFCVIQFCFFVGVKLLLSQRNTKKRATQNIHEEVILWVFILQITGF